MEIKKYNFIPFTYRIDRKLYKYFGNIDNAISSIQTRTIHLDDPTTYNDPFDGVFLHSSYTDFSSEEVFSKIIAVVHKSIATAAKSDPCYLHNKIMNAILVLALSVDINKFSNITYPISTGIEAIYNIVKTDEFTFADFCNTINSGYKQINPFVPVECKMSCFSEVHDSILMWSYYANNHKGVCIEYDLSLLDPKNSINRDIIECLTKVQYSPLRADRLIGTDDTSYLHFLITKSDVWSHEHEWRIICESEEEFLPFDCISGIYLGVNFKRNSPEYKRLCDAVNTHNNLTIYKGKRNLEIYGIDFFDIHNSAIINIAQTNTPLKEDCN